MLVLSGISTMARVARLESGEVRPTYVAKSLGDAVTRGQVYLLEDYE